MGNVFGVIGRGSRERFENRELLKRCHNSRADTIEKSRFYYLCDTWAAVLMALEGQLMSENVVGTTIQ